MRDSNERNGAGSDGLLGRRRSLQSLQLAAFCTVEHVPSAIAQAPADLVGRLEVALAPALDTLGQQLLSL
ncbi:MAG: hypothetical protein M3003_06455 [Candidatus Dormibacteraeota bacterium]|nr:hypothetical protein [Candidatus Dormibacteraeota bacterium]